ncbi:hypothetical protein [Marinococcus sp. PL1-022]|uniref:hypothetical protein n=1 Tax=Marinococcus sp. PL1-022 TaxID=3095363 RepID=UPI00260E4E79|nr:hypothetical protein [Marinococcus sp. PL1-022]MDX6152295.1 hypothetical protein [Marinococcus sp. PL1-022]
MSLFSSIKKRVTDAKENGVTIPVTEKMFLKVLQVKKMDNVDISAVHIQDQVLRIEGVKNDSSQSRFSMLLEPSHASERTLYFTLKSISPLEADDVFREIFDRPPYFSVQDQQAGFHLEVFEPMKKVPYGKIDSYYFEQNKLKVVMKWK